MKKYRLIILTALFSISFLLSNIYSFGESDRGSYNPIFKTIVCHDRPECLHEIGHASDHSMDWISRSEEYDMALTVYLVYNWQLPLDQRDPMAEKVAFFPGFLTSLEKEGNIFALPFWTGGWGGKTELYASILKWADGNRENVPSFFQEFYDWNVINKLISIHG